MRGPDEYDISSFVKQVVFSLHPSFNNSVRTFKSPPFEVHEEGWGEFVRAPTFFLSPLL